jgi:hypothetical protein
MKAILKIKMLPFSTIVVETLVSALIFRLKRILFFILLILLTNAINAQNKFRVELSGGPSLNPSWGLFGNWVTGVFAGGGLAYHLFNSFDVVMNASYQDYPFKGGHLQLLSFGEKYYVYGKRSNVFETSLGFRTSPKGNRIFPSFSIRTGVIRVHTGEIILSHDWGETIYHGTGSYDTKAFIAFDLGVGIRLASRLRAITEGRLTQSFDSRQTYVPLLLTVQYDLKK